VRRPTGASSLTAKKHFLQYANVAPNGTASRDEALRLTPSAKRDINEIWDYIARDSIEAAARVLDALESAMIKLAKNPEVGHWREELADKRHRFLLVYSYLIVYRYKTKPLQIVRVLHAARDLQSILGWSLDEP
jgi:plasmid stabilization system protein ParE